MRQVASAPLQVSELVSCTHSYITNLDMAGNLSCNLLLYFCLLGMPVALLIDLAS